jgi:hypothetical protein
VIASTGPGHQGFEIGFVGDPVVGLGCQPAVPPDPVSASIGVGYDNTGSATAAEATITGSRLHFSNGEESLVWAFAIDPKGSGPVAPGQAVQITHQKVLGSGFAESGTGEPCDYCGTAAEFELDMTATGQGAFSYGMAASVGCVR